MLNIRDLKIDNASLGRKMLLVDVVPAYEYKDKQRTDTITGYRYVVCLVNHHLEKLNVRIDGAQLMEQPDSFMEVKFEGLEVTLMFMPGVPCPIMIAISGADGPVWKWNGDKKNPTFSPSILTRLPWEGLEVVNHVFIRDGRIQYLNDCSHEYSGMTMELPKLNEWPEDFLLRDA